MIDVYKFEENNHIFSFFLLSIEFYLFPFKINFVWTSTANQNLMPNLRGLFGIYCVSLQQAFVGNNCSSTEIFSYGL